MFDAWWTVDWHG